VDFSGTGFGVTAGFVSGSGCGCGGVSGFSTVSGEGSNPSRSNVTVTSSGESCSVAMRRAAEFNPDITITVAKSSAVNLSM
jgi:hypothetical protein